MNADMVLMMTAAMVLVGVLLQVKVAPIVGSGYQGKMPLQTDAAELIFKMVRARA